MADALVSAVLEQLTSIIRREVEKEVKLVVGVREEIRKLSSELTMLQAVLDDAEEKQVKEKAVKLWLEKLKDVVYDADDVLDEWNTRTIVSHRNGVGNDVVNGGIRKKVLSYLFYRPCFCFKDVVVRHEIGHRIKEVRKHLNVIVGEKNQYNLIERRSPDRPRQLTSSLIDVSEVYGREDDKAVILGMLFGESSHQVIPVPVISIVGTAGFGKTTLAKLILKEDKVMTVFEKTMWVCVSEPFDLVRVAKEIIEQAGEQIPNVVGWDALHKCLCKSLRGKKFILVLDDVWTDDANEWNPLKLALDGGASGSRVLITTRNEKVAQMVGSTQNRKLGELSKDDSWLLFRLIAFQGREEDLKKLEDIGKQIAEKCKGVPLSVRSIASLMRLKKTKKEWHHVLTSEIWNIQNVEKDILPSLFLSYYPLPSNLKQCFIYCAVFPKDMRLENDRLVKLWMAQGFLGSEGSRDLEKIGEEYYDDLAMRSFFQDFDRDSDGNITSCKMHDLVHDFAQFLAKSECSILETNDTIFDESKVRHLATLDLEYSSIYTAKKLRTFLTTPKVGGTVVPPELYHQLTCLRTLDLGGCIDIKEVPDEVGKLLHLRYLNLWGTNVSELPETVTDLYNLQTLELNSSRYLRKLPDSISKLSNLRHLGIKGTGALGYLPRGIGRLGFLRTLSKFIVDGGSKECKMGELKFLNFLQGDLEIHGLERVTDMNEAAEAELEKKKDLHKLTLKFGRTNERDAEKMEGVLKKLQPHENLEELQIEGYQGLQFPDWITRASTLVTLTLSGCEQLRVLPELSKLKSLEGLYLRDLDKMEECKEMVPSDSEGEGDIQLPRLRKVNIQNCPRLKVVPRYIFSHTLKSLIIWRCPKLGGVQPCLPPLLEDLQFVWDVGVFSKSLPVPVGEARVCSHNSSYPNLKSVNISFSPHSSLPRGFNQLTAIQSLELYKCETLDFELGELKHLTMLQYLTIGHCPILKECFGDGKDWSILSHVPKIIINGKDITRRN